MRVQRVFLALLLAFWSADLRSAEPNRSKPDARALTAQIDARIAAGWKANGVVPVAAASDGEFLRRVYLDLAGRIPRVQEVRDFLEDVHPDKRSKVIDQLLDGAGYAHHFAAVYRQAWLPQTLSNPLFQGFGGLFEQWMRKQLRENVSYDAMVRELVTIPPNGQTRASATGAPAPIAFLAVNELKPEEIASSTARLFLGVKIECAQCHDHPFDTYSREQFWEFASFFAGLQPTALRGRRAPTEAIEIRSLAIPGTEKKVTAKFLDGKKPAFTDNVSSRITLVEWMTAKDNPYFARNAANRMWAYFFGTGLIDPLDEPGEKNPPSHPELLSELAQGFAASGYDIKFLIRAIVNSRAYQLTSAGAVASTSDDRMFARMKVRGLTPEQLFDSLSLATGYREHRPSPDFVAPNTPRGEFLARFASTERMSDVQTSILQALTLMNGKFISEMTSFDRSETLAGIADAPFMDTNQRIQTLYMAALARQARPDELSKLVTYVERGGPSGDRFKALADVFWALLNSSEFGFNH